MSSPLPWLGPLERYFRRQGALNNVNFKHLRKWERQVDYSHKGYPPAIIERQVPQVGCFLSSNCFFWLDILVS